MGNASEQIAERSAIAEQFSFGIQNDRSNVQELDIDRDERWDATEKY